jgi:dynein heavy chain
LNQREEIVGKRPTNYQQIFQIRTEFTPYCRLWFIVKDFRTNVPRWMKGPVKDLNAEGIVKEIEGFEYELVKLERRAMKSSPAGLKLTLDLTSEI